MAVDDKIADLLNGSNAQFVAEMLELWGKEPQQVDPSWADLFAEFRDDSFNIRRDLSGASWAPRESRLIGAKSNGDGHSQSPFPSHIMYDERDHQSIGRPSEQIRDSIQATALIHAYRMHGHLEARLDPLGLNLSPPYPDLDPARYGFRSSDYDRSIFINHALGLEQAKLSEIISLLRKMYCGSVGVEYMHIQNPARQAWFQERIERIHPYWCASMDDQCAILDQLTKAEGFERFLDRKFKGSKRFGLDGGESIIPALKAIAEHGAQLGVCEIVIGMAHRGRLNILASIMDKPYQAIFSEFQGARAYPEEIHGSGDVKYHLGTSADCILNGLPVHLSLSANPSHLEAVNPVVLGKVRAKQSQRGDSKGDHVMAILIHGDAAFVGQGVVAECLDMCELKGYQTGGAIHVVINNQIGFTTSPESSRSSAHCSDFAKAVGAPVLHVNADDPEAVVASARLAIEFRQSFKSDVVLDVVCYRRHGHNEGDEPSFTQPKMYACIAKHESTRALYAQKLEKDGIISPGAGKQLVNQFDEKLAKSFENASAYKPNRADWMEGKWLGLKTSITKNMRASQTSVEQDLIHEIGPALCSVPDSFAIHPKLSRLLKARERMIETGDGFDWSTAEALAFGTLLAESTPVRVSGQDSARGTFSQRHAVLVDQKDGIHYSPFDHIRSGQASFEVINSPLSEYAVLGFEYGYSLAEPQTLVIWEAQFGDFANGAQVIIDQFLCSSELKWLRMSGLVLLLPHGFEGQGPEHSSARIERYLQLSAENNWQVCNVTTPAQYFHVLRRQVRRDFRKPLILMTPKSLLRHKRCVSKISDFTSGSSFQHILVDDPAILAHEPIQRVVLCQGKVYYDLLEERERLKSAANRICLIRLEQIYPFPEERLASELERFKNAEIVWCQEEPRNMGAWSFVRESIEKTMKSYLGLSKELHYIGRSEAASPATGWLATHQKEQEALIHQALSL